MRSEVSQSSLHRLGLVFIDGCCHRSTPDGDDDDDDEDDDDDDDDHADEKDGRGVRW
jgi:hypothetical protein